MLKKKITNLLITAALLTSVMPVAFADTTEQPPQMPTQSQGEQPPAKPDGDQSDGEQPPQMPNGEQPQGDMNVEIYKILESLFQGITSKNVLTGGWLS